MTTIRERVKWYEDFTDERLQRLVTNLQQDSKDLYAKAAEIELQARHKALEAQRLRDVLTIRHEMAMGIDPYYGD